MILPIRVLLQVATSASCISSTEFSVPMPAGHSIAAVVETSAPDRRLPTIVLISGAGPSDRNHYTDLSVAYPDSVRYNGAFQALSRYFAARGYAVVRFDEIGTGRSTGSYDTATTATLARDLRGLVTALQRRVEVDPNHIVLLGYSEGGAIAGIVGAESPGIAAVVLLAAPAWSGDRIMAYQNQWDAEHDTVHGDLTLPARLARLQERDRLRAAEEPWFRYFLTFDPLPALQRLGTPVLVLQGKRDTRVTEGQAREIAAALKRAGNHDVSVTVFEQMDHTFTDPASAVDPKPLGQNVFSEVDRWLAVRVPGGEARCR